MLIVTYVVHKNLLMKPKRFYAIIFDAVYASLTLSSLLSILDIGYQNIGKKSYWYISSHNVCC